MKEEKKQISASHQTAVKVELPSIEQVKAILSEKMRMEASLRKRRNIEGASKESKI
jgi:hypothetical protein